MDPGILVPVSLFVCIAYSIKSVVDARTRGRLLEANRSDEIIRAILLTDDWQRRYSALHWGIVLVCLAGGFALIELIGWRQITPGGIALLLAATGVGNIISYLITRLLATKALDVRQTPESTHGSARPGAV